MRRTRRAQRNGAGCRKLPEPGRLVVSQTYNMSWDRIYLNLTEVARLRWVERWSLDSIALHFATTKIAIKERLRSAKLNPSRVDWTVIDPKHSVIRKMKKRLVALAQWQPKSNFKTVLFRFRSKNKIDKFAHF